MAPERAYAKPVHYNRLDTGYDKCRRDFSKLVWQTASPKWDFDNAALDRSAAAFDNPDHVAIVIHNYRWRQNGTQR